MEAYMTRWILVLSALLLTGSVSAQQYTKEQLEEWFFDDSDTLVDDVNEGELAFLARPPVKPVHHHHNSVTITDTSLSDGWVKIHQCHANMDEISLAEVLFSKDKSRALTITRADKIEKAWVEGHSVQLVNVGKGARLCISAETRKLERNQDGSYSLHSGPFMRRFLDGYYPMHVSMDVDVKTGLLSYASASPVQQDGFRVWQSADKVHVEAWFEGRLQTEINFQSNRQQAALAD
jgi:hypothetical protein